MFVKLIRYLHYVIFENIRDAYNHRRFYGILKTYNYQLV